MSHQHSSTNHIPQPQPNNTFFIKTSAHTETITTDQNPVSIIHPAAMSGTAGSAKDLTSPKGKAASQAGRSEKAPQTPQKQTPQKPDAPRSMPDTSESNLDGSNSGDNEGEMVPAAGRINEKGEVVDDDGNAIGKVVSGEASKFGGYIVTQEGDILDNDGSIVGKAEPLDDVASELNYTTKSTKDDGASTVGGTAKSAGSAAGGAASGLGQAASSVTGAVGDTVKGATDTVGEATGTGDATDAVGDTVKGATDTAGDATEKATGAAGEATEDATDKVGETAEGVKDTADDTTEGVKDTAGETAEGAQDTANDTVEGAQDTANDTVEGVKDATDDTAEDVKDTAGETVEEPTGAVDEAGEAGEDAAGQVEEAAEGAPSVDAPDADQKDVAEDVADEQPSGSKADLDSKIQEVQEKADEAPSAGIPSLSPSLAQKVVAMFEGPFTVQDGGKVHDKSGKVIGKLAAGSDIQDLVGKQVNGIDQEGNLFGENETIIGKVDILPEGSIAQKIKEQIPEAAEHFDAVEKAQEAAPDAEAVQIPSFAPTVAGKVIAMFEGPFNVAEGGQVTDQNGKVLGKLAEGQDYEELVGKDIKNIDEQGQLLGENQTVLGKVELVPEGTIVERIKEEVPEAADRLDAIDAAKQQAEEQGEEVEGQAEEVEGQAEEGAEGIELPPISILAGLKINKAGNVVDEKGNPLGKVKSGEVKKMIGKSPDKNGKVWDGSGNVIGEVEVLPEAVENMSSPFEDFPDATVDKFGKVIFDGRQVGVVVGDDFQNLIGKKVDADGDILDKNGNVIGHAERQEAEEVPEPEEEAIDYSMLRDKKVNKLGNVVDDKGQIWGHVVQGIVKNLVGKRVGEEGQIFNDAGKVITPGGDVVGRLVEGDPKALAGRPVDDDGDILDKNGNTLGRAERWEEPEVEKEVNPMSGRKVNREGNVVDEDGDIMGKLTSGELSQCAGKKIDDDGDVVDQKGTSIGHVSLLEEIPKDEREISPMNGRRVNRQGDVVDENGDLMGKLTSGDLGQCIGKPIDEDGDVVDQKGNRLGHCSLLAEIPEEEEAEPEPEEPTETDEEREARLQLEQDKKIANQISYCISQSLDKIKPILKDIVDRINIEESKKEADRDEEELVKQVRPLIEQGGKILTEANGVIRGLDPDGRISANAQGRAASREATPEEYHLAELLKELTGSVTETIENAKRKLENLPKAKKGINPLWGLLSEPLFQIIAAVGLLLSGVLGLVGKLLNGLGLGGIVNNLLGGLGLNKVLDGLGLGSILAPITGGGKK
ncbi:hypothetical protein F5Y18DRAFT_262215 [Xylariaceae sp. FL1019]|nr:hypothetical protein F5Y18DRAFT_262215 [Xylariaceae sp. FL1019]